MVASRSLGTYMYTLGRGALEVAEIWIAPSLNA